MMFSDKSENRIGVAQPVQSSPVAPQPVFPRSREGRATWFSDRNPVAEQPGYPERVISHT
jgi:hypothetical protein